MLILVHKHRKGVLFLNIVIVGIGGVGGILGGKLALHNSENVNFFTRGETLEKILSNGFEFRSNNKTHIVRPKMAANDPYKIGKADVVIFAVKNYSLESAANQIAPIIEKETVIIPLLNGLEAELKLKETFRLSQVLGGCMYLSAFIVSPGVVQQNGNVLKVLFGDSNLTEEDNLKKYSGIRDTFVSAGINTILTSDIENEMWKKFIMISSLATVTSVYMKNVGELFSDKESLDMYVGLIHEIVSVAKAKGIVLPLNIEEETLNKASAFVPETKTSMQLDFEKGNRNELEALTGYVCREASKLGIDVALYKRAYNKLKIIA